MKNPTGTPVKTVCWPLDSCSCCLCGCARILLTTNSDVSQNCHVVYDMQVIALGLDMCVWCSC